MGAGILRVAVLGVAVAALAGGGAGAGPAPEPLVGMGLLRAESQISLRAGVSGKVRKVLRREGEALTAGEAVVEMDSAEAELQLALARCDLESAEIAARKVRDGARKEDLERARAFYHEAKAGQDLAERTLKSDLELHAAGMLSDLSRQRSERSLDAARAVAESRRLDLAIMEKGPRAEDLRLVEIDTERRRVIVAQRELEVARLRIGGGREGRAFVTRVLVEEGAWLSGDAVVAEVAYMDRLRVDLDLAAEEGLALRAGAAATLRADLFPGVVLRGRVIGVSPVVDPATGTIHVVVLADNPDLALRPGVAARVEIER